jgi:hypothetical protein
VVLFALLALPADLLQPLSAQLEFLVAAVA